MERTDDVLVLTSHEAAARLGISRAFAYDLVHRGDLPVLRLGQRPLVPRAALEEFVASSRTGIASR